MMDERRELHYGGASLPLLGEDEAERILSAALAAANSGTYLQLEARLHPWGTARIIVGPEVPLAVQTIPA
jgi:hypothetical protein